MISRQTLTAIAISCYLAGCAIGPDFELRDTSNTEVSEQFHQQDKSQAVDNAPSLAAKEWRDIHKDEILHQLIDEALANNHDLETARSNLRAASYHADATSASLWPWFDLALETSRERESDGSYGTGNELKGALSWEVDLWGVNRRKSEASDASFKQAGYDLYSLQVSIVSQVANTYFDLLDLDNQREITEATIATRKEALRILNLRKESGVISGIEVRQAELALAEAKHKLPRLKQSQHTTENQLGLLLGRAPGDVERASDLSQDAIPSEIPVGLPSDLLLRRADLKAAEQIIVAANADVGISQGALLPSISLTGEFGKSSSELTDILSGNDFWLFETNLAAPIFHAGALRANLKVAKEEYKQALIGYQQKVNNALKEVSNGISAYHLSKEQEEATQDLLAAANKYLKLAVLQYRNGVLGYIDVLDAQRQQFDAELALSSAKRDRLKAITFLYRALGGGWQQKENASGNVTVNSSDNEERDTSTTNQSTAAVN
mgnify:CR=1 FL=1